MLRIRLNSLTFDLDRELAKSDGLVSEHGIKSPADDGVQADREVVRRLVAEEVALVRSLASVARAEDHLWFLYLGDGGGRGDLDVVRTHLTRGRSYF